MLRYTVLALLLLISPAAAQQQFVPFTIDQQTYQTLLGYLGEVPAKYANPVLSVLAQKQQEAAKAKAEAKENKPEK